VKVPSSPHNGWPRPRALLRVRVAFTVSACVGALLAITGVGTAVAVAPCSFPTAASGGLDQDAVSGAMLDVAPTGYVHASDGTPLAYFAFLPAKPVASLVFYHGSGAHSTAGYLPLGRDLAERYAVATYLVDIRGHGSSGGPRGDAPGVGQVWDDTRTVVDFVHAQHPDVPEYVGGHSAGAALVLNSVARLDRTVAGYVLLAPDFGLRSGTTRQSGASNFVTVCQRPFVAHAVTGGVLDAHAPAIGFAYTEAQIRSAGLVPRYTVTMALALGGERSASILAGLDRPLGVWIGSLDEVFDPAKVLDYAASAGGTELTREEITGADHLGVLEDGAASIGPWIDAHADPSATARMSAGDESNGSSARVRTR
jgi:alpha-beta hydrolase superfamily lysophospholipase